MPAESLTFRSAVLLDDGRVLTVGGEHGASPSRSAALWDPRSGEWRSGPPTEDARHYPLLVKTETGQVVVLDKRPPVDGSPTARRIETWDGRAGGWRTIATLISSTMISAAIPVRPHHLYVVDASGGNQWLDLTTGMWTDRLGREGRGPLPAGAVVVPVGRDGVMGMAQAGFDTWIWSRQAGRWTPEQPPPHFAHDYPEDLRLVPTNPEGVLAIQPSAKRAAFWSAAARVWHEIALPETVYPATRNLVPLADGSVLASEQFGRAAWTITPQTGATLRVASLPYRLDEGTMVPLPGGGALLLTGRSAEVWRPTGKAAGRFLSASQTLTGQCCDNLAALSDGSRILLARGSSVGSAIWDPRLRAWSPTGGTMQDHDEPGTVALRDGRVMVAGGLDRSKPFGSPCRPGPPDRVLSSTEIWDPSTGEWHPGGSLNQRQSRPTLLQLKDGRVLALHGEICTRERDPNTACVAEFCRPSKTGEVWDSAAAKWTAIAPYTIDRPAEVGAAVLGDGRVLLVGGSYTDRRAETWGPGTGSWSIVAAMSIARASPQVTPLADGRVLVTGGGTSSTGGSSRSAEIFDPRTNHWVLTSVMESGRRGHSAALLADGRVLVAGGAPGEEVARAEVWNPGDGLWSVAGNVTAHDPRGHLIALRDDSAAFIPVNEPIELWRSAQ